MALNPLDQAIDQLRPTPTIAPAASAPPPDIFDNAIDRIQSTNDITLRQSLTKASDVAPEQAAEARRIAGKFGVPVEVAQRNLAEYQQREAAPDAGALQSDTPALGNWLTNQSNASLAQNEHDALGRVEHAVRAWTTGGYIGDLGGAVEHGYNELRGSTWNLAAAFGLTDPWTAAEHAADANARMTVGKPDYVAEFEKTMAEKGKAVNAAVQSFNESGPPTILTLQKFKAGLITVGEALDMLGAAVVRPRGLGYATAESLPALLPMIFGGVAGGAVGTAGGPAAPVTVPIGIGVGTFLSTSPTEVGRDINARLQAQRVDVTNATDLARAYSDPALMADVRSYALKKGLTTAAVTGLVSAFGGQVARLGEGAATAGKLAAGAADVSVQAAGMGGAQVAGEAAVGEKPDVGAALNTAISTLAFSVAHTAIGKAYGKARSGAAAAPAGEPAAGAAPEAPAAEAPTAPPGTPEEASAAVVEQAKAALRTSQGIQALADLGTAAKEAKTTSSVPDAIKALVDTAAGGDNAEAVYFNPEDWQTFWQAQGRSPADMAGAVMHDGGQAFYEAQATHAPLAVPLSDYVAGLGNTEHWDGLLAHARVQPDGMTLSEAHTYLQALPAVLSDLAARAEGEPPVVEQPAPTSSTLIRDDLTAQLTAAGYGKEPARAAAVLASSAFETIANEIGVKPEDLYRSYIGPNAVQGEPGAPPPAAAPAAAPVAAQPAAADVNAPINAMSNIGAAALRMLRENPDIYSEARKMRERAQAAGRIPEPPREAKSATIEAPNVEVAGAAAGEHAGGPTGEQPAAHPVGSAEAGGNGARAERSRLPSLNEVAAADAEVPFQRASKEEDAARLTPDVVNELTSIRDELHEFPFTERTWTWLTNDAGPNDGNAAGGHANIVAGAAGAPVYDDVLQFSPANKGKSKLAPVKSITDLNKGDEVVWKATRGDQQSEEAGTVTARKGDLVVIQLAGDQKVRVPIAEVYRSEERVAKMVNGTRAAVEAAIDKTLESSRIWNNLAEGAVRVAERRAANDYRDIERPALPPHWGAAASDAMVKELSDSIDTSLEGADVSFNPKEFNQGLFDEPPAAPAADTLDTGEQQPRLPEAGAVRDQNIATPELDVPFSLTGEVSKAKKGKQTTLFQSNEKDLVVTHNLTERNLLHSEKLGGLPVPSLAITRKGETSTNFGEITLVGDKKLADPKAGARVFGADVYSPRYPTVHYAIDRAAEKRLSALFKENGNASRDRYIDLDSLQKEGAHYLENSPAVMAAFFKERDVPVPEVATRDARHEPDMFDTRIVFRNTLQDRGLVDDFASYAQQLFESLKPTEKIFKGFTDQGNRRYTAHSLENVVRILKANLRGGESESNLYGVGQLRAKFTPQFRSLEGIRRAKGLLVSDAQFEDVKKEVEQDFFGIADALKGSYGHSVDPFRFTDTVMAVMEDAPKMGLTKALKDYGFADVPEGVQTRIGEFLQKLRAMPTEYFEAKHLRAVDIGEFAGAAVPDNASQKTLDLLKEKGVQVATYKAGDAADRQRAVADLSDTLSERVLFQGQGNRRGSISFGPDNQAVLRIFKNADASTVVHEFGHLFLQVMRDAAPKSARIAADLVTLQDWFEKETGSRDVGTEQHELMARGFERYLMEGKAPSAELRGVFSRFRRWLTRIYSQVRSLDANLTPEVRNVFDRLLATDDAIKRAEESLNAAPLFDDPRAVGMTEKQAASYGKAVEAARLSAEAAMTAKMMRQIQREESAQWKTWRKGIEADVTKAVDDSPLYKAIDLIRNGNEQQEPLKLNRKAVRELEPDKAAAIIKARLTADDGIHPDVAAEALGFPSGRALVNALADAPSRADAITLATNAKLQLEHGEPMDDATIQQHAVDAVRSTQRTQLLRKELEFLITQHKGATTGILNTLLRAVPPTEEVRRQAATLIDQKPVGQLRPDLFNLAAAREGKAARTAFIKGDIGAAIEAKRREILLSEVYRAGSDARDEVTKTLAGFRELRKADTTIAATRNLDFVQAARAVLANYDIGSESSARRAATHLLHLKEYDPGAYDAIDETIRDAAVNAQPYRQMPVKDFRAMAETVNSLWELARSAEVFEVAGERRALADVRQQVLDQVGRFNEPRALVGYKKAATQWDKFAVGALGFKARMRRVEAWASAVDNGREGIARSAIVEPINAGAIVYDGKRVEVAKTYADIVTPLLGSKRFADLEAPELDYTFRDKHRELLGALLHTGNGFEPGSNGYKLLVGRGWGDVQEDGTVDPSRWQEFTARMQREGVLTKADYDYLQAVWDLNESLKPDAQRAHKARFGRFFDEVTAVPFTTPFGDYQGGYFPAIADPLVSPTIEDRGTAEGFDEGRGGGAGMFPAVGRGFTRTRTARYAKPLILDAAMVLGHINSVLKFTYLSEPVHAVARLILHPTFKEGIAAYDPAAVSDMLRPYLERAASQRMFTPIQGKVGQLVNAVADRVRSAGSMQLVALNARVLAEQTTHFISAPVHADLDATKLLAAAFRLSRQPFAMAAEIREASPYMATRESAGLVEAHDAIDRVLLDPSPTHRAVGWISDHTTVIMRSVQHTMDVMAWQAAYDKVSEEPEMTHARAVKRADAAVREAMGSYRPQDRSAIESGNPIIAGLLNMFYGFFNTKLNVLGTEAALASRMGVARKYSRALAIYAIGFMAPAVAGAAIANTISGHPVNGDDDDDAASWARFWFESQLQFGSRMIPFVGPAVVTAEAAFGKKEPRDILSAPAITMVQDALHAPGEEYRALTGPETAAGAAKRIDDIWTLLGMLGHLPLRPIGQAYNALTAPPVKTKKPKRAGRASLSRQEGR